MWGGERPREMWRRGRAALQDFRPGEDLFYRLAPDQISGETVVVPVGNVQPPFSVPFSVNWSRFSQPDWVLIPPHSHAGKCYEDYRVCAIRVENLPDSYKGFALRPVHDPEEDNYSHSEVRGFDIKDQQFKRPGPAIRKGLRELLRREARPL